MITLWLRSQSPWRLHFIGETLSFFRIENRSSRSAAFLFTGSLADRLQRPVRKVSGKDKENGRREIDFFSQLGSHYYNNHAPES